MINLKEEKDVQIWCDYQEEKQQVSADFFLRLRFSIFRTFIANNFYSSGNGSGNGLGYGYGDINGNGNGNSYGYGLGYGYGYGGRDGNGYGYGDDDGYDTSWLT